MQRLLIAHGYDVGEPDGAVGTKTTDAIADSGQGSRPRRPALGQTARRAAPLTTAGTFCPRKRSRPRQKRSAFAQEKFFMSIRAVVFIAALAATGAIVQPALARRTSRSVPCAARFPAVSASSSPPAAVNAGHLRARAHRALYGTIQKFGLDIGATNRGTPPGTSSRRPRGRSATRSPATISASALRRRRAGLGADPLIGGSERSFTLQPLRSRPRPGATSPPACPR